MGVAMTIVSYVWSQPDSSLPSFLPPHGRCLGKLSSEVTKMKQRDAAKLNEEYQRLVRGLTETGVQVPAADAGMAGPGA